MRLLYDAPGRGCWITVTESDTTRYLELNGCEEGAMELHSEAPVFRYLWFHKCSHLAGGAVRRALVLGAGAFTAAKCLALDHPWADVDAVDIEPALEAVARQFFRLDRPEFARVRFHGTPAEEFLRPARPPYEFVFDDLFDGFQHVPFQTRARQHFELLRAVLAPGGVLVKNVIWDPFVADSRAACAEAAVALRATFPHAAVLALDEPHRGHNRLQLARQGDAPLDPDACRDRLVAAGLPEALLETVRWVEGE